MAKCRQAIELSRAGKSQEAKKLLESMLFEDDRILAPAVVMYAELLREEGKLKLQSHEA
ncbi:MAG: hypothetical protein QJR07_19895 [Acetobacteraceae bacterium]|uniref:Uncharacterized protein n=1 Tax=Carboxydichorda subterranea TaxID=3109565 RepID=A0ABZ1BWH8_9FIRM|nr:hypothetical protein [Limnochorda sp. L945t]MDI3309342.1 hypothetical protein [Acetobacteraceae bacterium]WRP17155.1 hypothetical protein U7230_13870 [Limnochorda sp. L945t]